MAKSIIIAERDNVAAVIENGKVSEFFVHRGEILLNDVYLAKVDNILPSIDAAFVDVGYEKMGFLHANDAIGKGSLKDKLSPKQKLIVQVVKEPTGHKGPRVTTSISLPGRFLVLMPHETGVNVSRKIVSQKERARLKSIVNLMKPVGLRVIVRTEAENQTEADIQEDLELLLEKWNSIITAAETHEAPSLLYRDQDLLYRVMREACSEDVKEIILDTSFAMHRTQQILQNWNMMNRAIDISVYKGTEPLLVASGVAKEIKSALESKVTLPSGGYLFIQATEALTVIDVNSGKFVSSATQDETILKTNKEAVQEIARQLRLRNIGGMIIVDFIDMTNRNDKLAIMEEFEMALDKDKAKPQIGQLSDLGLVELTRHRQGQALSEMFSKKCPHCQGNGYIAEDLTFSSSVAEGEYRSKAAKLKVPVQQLKQKNQAHKHNKVFSHQNQQQENKPHQENKPQQEQGQGNKGQHHFHHKKHNRPGNFEQKQEQIQEAVETQPIEEKIIQVIEAAPMQEIQPPKFVPKEAEVKETDEKQEIKQHKKPTRRPIRKPKIAEETKTSEVKAASEEKEVHPKKAPAKPKVTRKPKIDKNKVEANATEK